MLKEKTQLKKVDEADKVSTGQNKKGGKRPGGGYPKGLKQGEKLYEQIQMAVPLQLAPHFKRIIAEWKQIYKEFVAQTGKKPLTTK